MEETLTAGDYDFSEVNFFLAISALTEFHQDLLTLIYYSGYSIQEVSEIKHISRQAVNQAKNRALEKLREVMV